MLKTLKERKSLMQKHFAQPDNKLTTLRVKFNKKSST